MLTFISRTHASSQRASLYRFSGTEGFDAGRGPTPELMRGASGCHAGRARPCGAGGVDVAVMDAWSLPDGFFFCVVPVYENTTMYLVKKGTKSCHDLEPGNAPK